MRARLNGELSTGPSLPANEPMKERERCALSAIPNPRVS